MTINLCNSWWFYIDEDDNEKCIDENKLVFVIIMTKMTKIQQALRKIKILQFKSQRIKLELKFNR